MEKEEINKKGKDKELVSPKEVEQQNHPNYSHEDDELDEGQKQADAERAFKRNMGGCGG